MLPSEQAAQHKENLFGLISRHGEVCASSGPQSSAARDLLDLIRRELFREELLADLDDFADAPHWP